MKPIQRAWRGRKFRTCSGLIRQRRAGYTLIESLLVISVMGVLLLLTSTTLFSLFATHRRVTERTALQGTLSRLSLQLRSDAHAAREASAQPAADGVSTTVTLRMNDELAVDYQADSAGVRRVVRRRDETVHRELYRLGPLDRVQWRLIEGDSRRVVLRIRSGSDAAAGASEGDAAGDVAGGAAGDDSNDPGAADATLDLLRVDARLGLLPGEVPLAELEAGSDSVPAAPESPDASLDEPDANQESRS